MVPIYRIFRTSVQVMHVRKSHHALAASHRPAKLNSRADSHRSNMAKLATTGIAGSLRRAPKAAENEVNKHDARASVSEWRHRKPRLTPWRVVLAKTKQPCWFAAAELVVYEIKLARSSNLCIIQFPDSARCNYDGRYGFAGSDGYWEIL